MRTIKFRGKRLDNGEWVEGDLIQGQGTKAGRMYILPHAAVYPPGCHKIYGWNVDPATVGQFTGLTDKNGKDVWEGDVVKVWHERDDDDSFWTTGVVKYSPAEFYIIGDGYSITCHFHYNSDDRIVIGNIYDNPELLTK